MPFELLVLNILGLFASCLFLGGFRLFESVYSRFRNRLP
jgi:hypothetical protein